MSEESDYTLKLLEGQLILGYFHSLEPTRITQVRLHRVEQYGIWIESQGHIDKLLELHGLTMSEQTLVMFVPWSGVRLIFASTPTPSVSESALK
jgi:hypothetical protein